MRGMKPLASQFSDWMDSYWHKSENIPASRVEGMQELLDAKAEAATVSQMQTGFSEANADIAELYGIIDEHTSDTHNPHSVSKSQVGLGNVDNTSDANKPISTATQTALDGKAAASHTHTKAQVGLANVDNTSDANKPISTATQTALDGKAAASHTHTKSQVGLGNVDNTSDANKPISTATRTALNGKADRGVFEINDVNFNAHVRIEDNEYRYTLYDIPDKADVIVLNDARINTQGIGRIVGAIEYVNGKTIKVLNAGDSMTIATVESEYYTSNEGAIHGYGGLNINSYSFGKFRFIDFVYWNGGWYSPVYDYSPA